MRGSGRRSPAIELVRAARGLGALFVLAACAGCGGATEPASANTRAAPSLPAEAMPAEAMPAREVPGPGQSMSPEERAYAVALLGLTNQERARESLPPLHWDEEAAQAALDHAVYQQSCGRLQHEGAGASDAGVRLETVGIAWRAWAENIAVGYDDPVAVLTDWLASPPHRANLLAPALTHAGVGVRLGAGGIYDGPWVTQNLFTR